MTRSSRGGWAVTLVLVWQLGAAAQVHAAPPPGTEADALHLRAVAAARSKNWNDALSLWERASRRAPHWKYSFNRASVLAHLQRWREALQAIDDAIALSPPAAEQPDVVALGLRAEAQVLASAGLLVVLDAPPGAELRVDGASHPLHRRLPLTPGVHTLSMTAPGCLPESAAVEARVGERATRSLVCRTEAPTGTLRLAGVPADAALELDGQRRGALTDGAELRLAGGPHRVRVTAPGYHDFEAEVLVSPAVPASLELLLIPSDPAGGASPTAVAGWVTLGSGALLVAVGAGLLGHALLVNEDAKGLSRDSSTAYDDRYDRLAADYRASVISGWSLVGVGAGALSAGTGLLIWDALAPSD